MHWRRKGFRRKYKELARIEVEKGGVQIKLRDALRETACFANVPQAVWEKEWVVHCQPVGTGVTALRYLAPYIFRVAIGNSRILKLADGKVTFRYRKTDTGTLRTCTLPVEEFIRRFLQHVLPKGFVKVRYYGFLASGCRPQLTALHQQLGTLSVHRSSDSDVEDGEEQTAESDSSDRAVVLCPSCGQPMRRRTIQPGEHRPHGRCPP